MKAKIFAFLTIVMLLTMLVPISASAGAPPQDNNCQGGKCSANVYVDVAGIVFDLPGRIPQGAAYSGYVVTYVYGNFTAKASGPNGTAVASGLVANETYVLKNGQFYDYGTDSFDEFDVDWGRNAKAVAHESGWAVVLIPVSGVAPYNPENDVYVTAVTKAVGEAYTAYYGQGNDCFRVDFAKDWLVRCWVIDVYPHMAWKHLWERKIIFHANNPYILEFYEIGEVPGSGKYKPRDLVIDPKISSTAEYFCSGIGGGCFFWSWTEQTGLTQVGSVAPSTEAGADIHVWLDLPPKAPANAYPSYGAWAEVGGAVWINPVWSVAHGAPQ